MTDIVRSEPDLHRMVDELVKDHRHREAYIVRGTVTGLGRVAHHQTTVPALIDQLLEPAPGGTGEMSGTGAQARPAVRVEAHDTIELIATEAGAWLVQLGTAVPVNAIMPRSSLAAVRGSGAKRSLVVLRTLHAGLTGDDSCGRTHGKRIEVEVPLEMEDELGLDSKDSLLADPTDEPRPTRKVWCCTAHHIEHDVRYWWRQARIIAGWDSPTYRPFATCPACTARGGLRINLSTHTAVCVDCRTVWEPTSIGLLAEHVRQERGEGLDDPDLVDAG